MSTIKNIIAGLGGALALNLIHESLKRSGSGMPRIDLLGEEAIQKGIEQLGYGKIKDQNTLYAATLGGDLVSNAVYYSFIGNGNHKYIWGKAIALGLSAGIGAIYLPEPMGLDPKPVAGNEKKKVLTIAYYVAGALVTAGIVKALNRNEPSL